MAAVSAAAGLLPQYLNQRSKANTHLLFLKPIPPRHFHKHLPASQCLTYNPCIVSISEDAVSINVSASKLTQQVADLRSLCSQERPRDASDLLNEIENKHSPSGFDTFTYNNVLSSLIKQGKLDDAYRMFDKMPERNAISWSSIIAANTRSGNFQQAFHLFDEMMEAGTCPNEFALGSLLKASAGLRDVCIGRQLHGWCLRIGFVSDAGVRTSLITMYSSCGFLDDAALVFREIPLSSLDDVPTWNSMIAAYVFNGCWSECFQLFSDMLWMGLVAPTERTYASMINACGSVRALDHGKTIHGKIVKDGLLNMTTMGNSLITFYSKCWTLDDANKMFKTIPSKNIVSWNAIVAAHEQNDDEKSAIDLFHRLLRLESCAKPNRITFLSVLSAVSSVSGLKHGREIHAQMIKMELEDNTSIANSLITMYSKCGEATKARRVFERLPCRDIVSWNSMLAGFVQNEQLENCLELFTRMPLSGYEPDDHSFTIALGAVSSHPSMSKCWRWGREIHGHVIRQSSHAVVGTSTYNSILTMYAKCNKVADAEKIFKGINKRDSYSWNAMMDGYSINGNYNDVILLFIDMLEQSLQYDHLSFSILLTACGRSASIQLGKQFHASVVKHRYNHCNLQTSSLSINNALVSMYSKCGSISDASSIFVRMARRDVFSWTAMITGCAHHGMGYESLQLFERMIAEGIKPNSVTFLGVLTASAHAGLVNEGIHYFNSMSKSHNVNPSIEHYACMVDLFGRLGQFGIAKTWVEAGISSLKLEQGACLILWKVLLGACHAHKQLDLGVHAAMKILDLEPEDETTHILLSNLYAAFGMWSDAVRVRRWMKDKGLKKQEVGSSWIEVRNRRHVFVAGDVCHPHWKEIYEKLEALDGECRDMGYFPMMEYVLHDVDDLQKEAIIASHSEKLAVSFGLLQSGKGKGIIRVIKNLRVCGDCHNWMKFVSQVEGREIVLRDSRRFHIFKGGMCSCRDYW
ncbi:pentatricopeptide repeat-containing protein At3g49170, chloroplastic-like [Magnolia sinica]|uniref:pentatricopeptide repeat-containing protein At3g49170, chloroplastic-like n=1 Tax=Magnolia sinica TaxID=86752 RepID=UPI0026592781|nr:pentatricopeptide repeat-containing protein At3g49170, chloroplastic-like [Magnolia sinica]